MWTSADQCDIISLSDRGNMNGAHVNSKLGFLRYTQFSIISELVKAVAIDATLFHSQLVLNWPHQCFAPFNIGLTVAETIVEKNKAFTT